MIEEIYNEKVALHVHSIMNFYIKFLKENYGDEGLESFFSEKALYIYKRSLIKRIKDNGLIEMKKHLEKIFSLEGGKFNIDYKENELIFKVEKCPAIWNLKDRSLDIDELIDDRNREVDKDFCKAETYIVNKALAKECGFNFSVDYDQENGKCVQRFWKEVKQ